MPKSNAPVKVEKPTLPSGFEDFESELSGGGDQPLRIRIGKYDDGDTERIGFIANDDLWMPVPRLDDIILLNPVKQRTLWNTELDGEGPMCKSYNFKEGHPDADRFPWEESGVDTVSEVLDCKKCNLKNWGSHPDTNRKSPWCAEVIVFPAILEPGTDVEQQAFISFQRSGLKATKGYLLKFARQNLAMFSHFTTIGYERQRYQDAGTTYGTPTFTMGERTDESEHEAYQEASNRARQFLTTGPSATANVEVLTGGNARSELVADVLDGDDPF